jgi:hypothetical protein
MNSDIEAGANREAAQIAADRTTAAYTIADTERAPAS